MGWNLGLRYKCSVHTANFWQSSAQGHSGVIRYISDFRQACISKMVVCRAKQSEIWASAVSAYRVLLTDKYVWSFQGHSVHFRFLIILYLENAWSYRETEWNLGLGSEYSVCTWKLLSIKCLRSFWGHWCLSDFRNLVSRKRKVF